MFFRFCLVLGNHKLSKGAFTERLARDKNVVEWIKYKKPLARRTRISLGSIFYFIEGS